MGERHLCVTVDGATITCLCAIGRDHDEEDFYTEDDGTEDDKADD